MKPINEMTFNEFIQWAGGFFLISLGAGDNIRQTLATIVQEALFNTVFGKGSKQPRLVSEGRLFDDKSTREKAKVCTKWEIIMDDGRNTQISDEYAEQIEDFLKWGKKYRITIEELPE